MEHWVEMDWTALVAEEEDLLAWERPRHWHQICALQAQARYRRVHQWPIESSP